ncbi:MAG: oligosaccharide flippase family protein [bacterium]|nr:oligosaccharide flippase family protein [bacterium]
MEEIDVAAVKRRSVAGVVALTSRMALMQVVSFFGIFLLTIFLDPRVFGIFFVVTAIVSFLRYFSDIGLAAALIQKKEEITRQDLETTFTIQQTLVLIVVISAFILSGFVGDYFKLGTDGLWLFRALIFAFLLSSFKTIPSIILERKLDFNRLVIPEIIETVLYYLVAVVLAWKGLGVVSFTWAVLARGVSGLLVIYLLAPWRPGLAIHKQSARKLLSFGAPFQLYSFLALIKDDLLMVFLGKVLPFAQVGYIGWAKKWAEYPLRLVMDSIIKVTFPAYSRLQEHPEDLRKGIEKAIYFLSLLIFPALIGLAFVVKPMVFLIPKYIKWEPALTSLYFFAIASILASLSSPLVNAILAIGRIKTALKLMIMWTALVWILTPVFIVNFGFNGVASSQAVMSLTLIVVIYVAKQYFVFSVRKNIYPQAAATFLMGVGLYFISPVLSQNLLEIVLLVLFGAIIYVGSLWIVTGGKVWGEVQKVIAIFKGR